MIYMFAKLLISIIFLSYWQNLLLSFSCFTTNLLYVFLVMHFRPGLKRLCSNIQRDKQHIPKVR